MIDTKYISPKLNDFRKECRITEQELVNKTGITEDKLHRILYDAPYTSRNSYYPISPADKDKLIETFKVLAKKPLTPKDLDRLFIPRHQDNGVDSPYDEAIFNWFFKERIDVDVVMQLLLYFDVYDSVDNLTAQIALFYIHMNDSGKEKTRQKSFPLSAYEMKCYAFSNYEKISKLKLIGIALKAGRYAKMSRLEFTFWKENKILKKQKRNWQSSFLAKIGLGISDYYNFEEPKRNNSFKNAVEAFY